MADLTWNDIRELVREAICNLFPPADPDDPDDDRILYVYVEDMTDDWAIYEDPASGQTMQVSYSVDINNAVVLGEPRPVVRVTTYMPDTGRSAPGPRQAEQRHRPPRARTVRIREPLTYAAEARHSYFVDLLAIKNDVGAQQRLARHALEMAVEMPEWQARRAARDASPDGLQLERRVNPNTTQGTGGYFTPPLWLIDLFATANRPARVLGAMMPNMVLPSGVSSLNLPALSTGSQVGAQNPGAGVPYQDLVDAQVSAPVVTIAGMVDAALQMLQQGPAFDRMMFQDLTEAYDADLELQLINGAGGGELSGVIGQALAGNQIIYTDMTPTGSKLYPYFGQAYAKLGDNRLLSPEFWMMRTARYAWLAAGEDTSARPFDVPDAQPGDACLLSKRILENNAIPATLGAGMNQDAVILLRPSDGLLAEGAPQVGIFEEVLSGTLQVRLRLHAYVAAFTGRRPAGIATITGTGLVVQSGE